jgi:hypothetical protein
LRKRTREAQNDSALWITFRVQQFRKSPCEKGFLPLKNALHPVLPQKKPQKPLKTAGLRQITIGDGGNICHESLCSGDQI